MASIKPPHFPRCLDCRHVEESTQQSLSWMTRPNPGIRWQGPARVTQTGSGLNPTAFQPHYFS